jgi:hypothetical protein
MTEELINLEELGAIEDIPVEYIESLSKETVLQAPLETLVDESNKLFVGRFLTQAELIPYLKAQKKPDRKITTLHIHHTWSPTPTQWYGYATLKGVADYYHDVRGWTWGRIPTFWVAQQYYDGPWGFWIATHPYYPGIHCPGYNTNGYGVEVCWNGNLEPFTLEQKQLLSHLVKAVNVVYGVPMQHSHRAQKTVPGIRIHRYDYSTDCPGYKNVDSMVDEVLAMAHVTKTISKGDKGEEVGWLQQALKQAGYRLDITNAFDNRTEALVKSFQGSKGLDTTGVATATTWEAFGRPDRLLKWKDDTMVGMDVTWVKRILARRKYYKEPITDVYAESKFDSKLHAAVGLFQKDCGVDNDGIVGPITWRLLRYWSN